MHRLEEKAQRRMKSGGACSKQTRADSSSRKWDTSVELLAARYCMSFQKELGKFIEKYREDDTVPLRFLNHRWRVEDHGEEMLQASPLDTFFLGSPVYCKEQESGPGVNCIQLVQLSWV